MTASGGADGSKNMLGWTAQAGLAFLDRRRVFSEISARYHGMGSVRLEEVTLTGSSFPGEPPQVIVVPASDLAFSHWTVGVSFGVKFQ